MRDNLCLNGWWDFWPVLAAEGAGHLPPGTLPSAGWQAGGMLVPGSWTRGGAGPLNEAVRRGGGDSLPWAAWRISDNYGYPAAWDATCTAWYRRSFEIEAVVPGRRYELSFGGILRQAWVYVNGALVGQTFNGTMPYRFDCTEAVRAGPNELAVYVTDYRRDAKGKSFTPYGADQMVAQKGIWQDVFLEWHADLFVEDVTIRTSVRDGRLTVIARVENRGGRRRTAELSLAVLDGGGTALTIPGPLVDLGPGEQSTVTVEREWRGFRPWSPQRPHLYRLRTALAEAGLAVDERVDRFGFRELWVEGPHLLLNGSPVHLFGEWAHKDTFDCFRPEYIRQWFGMLKDMNMNYIRTHTYPHTSGLLELADELGVLVCVESGFMFGGGFALDQEEFWQGALQHVRDIVRRDKNHPSVILWSVGNETRWSGNQGAIIRNAPRLRALYEELDPTRIAYHDGDSSLWDERHQPLLSRHYGFECAGDGWWDKRRPLHVGEVGKWHYGQPVENCVWGDDGVFASFFACHRAIARECADLAHLARANGVCCFFPWNHSGLDNFRPWGEERTFDWPAPESPGLKVLRSGPHAAEFAWWESDGKGYAPGVGFEIMQHAFRPVAIVVREKRSRFFADGEIVHTATVVNDSGATLVATLGVELETGGGILWRREFSLRLAAGHTATERLAIPLPAVAGAVRLRTRVADFAQLYDEQVRDLEVTPVAAKTAPWSVGAVALVGDGGLAATLAAHGVRATRVANIAAAEPAATPVLLVEAGAVVAGSRQNAELRQFLAGGGRAVILEQSNSIFPTTTVDNKPTERCHLRGGQADLLRGFEAADFAFWGDDPFGRPGSDAFVVEQPYRKPTQGCFRMLLHSGFGDFGGEGLSWTPLLEVRSGGGTALACQLRVSDRLDVNPVALRLLRAMLEYASAWQAPAGVRVEGRLENAEFATPGGGQAAELLLADGAALGRQPAAALAARVAGGATALVVGVTPATAADLAAAFAIDLTPVDLGPFYHLVRAVDHPWLDGISNQESFWLDAMTYSGQTGNRLMGETLLRSPQGEELLVSERESCWREFVTQEARSEWLRMPVATHYLWNGPRESAAGLLRISHGRGQLLLCQIPWVADDYGKGRTFWRQLLTNLGTRLAEEALAGEEVARGSKLSDGYPLQIGLIVKPSSALFEQVLAVAAVDEYRLPNQAIASGFDWRREAMPGGELAAVGDGADDLLLMFQIKPGRPRVSVRAEGDWPDPSQQTLLDLRGQGEATLYVNGHAYAPVDLSAGGAGTVADIELPQVWNTILLRWRGATGPLAIQWRNRQGQPEVEFAFTTKA